MRIVIIGSTGHVGTFLVPRLVNAGHHVISVTRNERQPYLQNPAWSVVQQVIIDRNDPAGRTDFGSRIAALNADVVIDMICFDKPTAQQMVAALQGRVRQYVFCGTIWVYGHSVMLPTGEESLRRPLTGYGKNKAEAEAFLLQEAEAGGFPATVLHPGHIVGPGWRPVNPAGHLNLDVFKRLAKGMELTLPNLGMEMLHHVHADDVAQAFVRAIENPAAANGQSFNIVSPQAMTMRGYAEVIGAWLGKETQIKYLPWEQWKVGVSEEDASITWDHLIHSPCCSIEKARRLIHYQPGYSAPDAIKEALEWQINLNGLLR
ncbi:MAG: NAD-dependent epimerase/dehydratase family protein [Chitinophagaceae bacterium]|nr:NAD-dependent epimerase/dehydratase family protein [Chitinophagaceae bacterium]